MGSHHYHDSLNSYRIPMPKKSTEKDYYAKILNSIRDIESDEVKQSKKQRVRVQRIASDDVFVKLLWCVGISRSWLKDEDFDDITASLEDDDNKHDFVYSDIQDFLINLTVWLLVFLHLSLLFTRIYSFSFSTTWAFPST